jgi:endonuclease/exonuclease/phosphatase family metal-dependent hydrolase
MKRQISLLSWNLHGLPRPLAPNHSERLRRVTTRALQLKPDLIAFQEVWLDSDQVRMAATLRSAGYEVFAPASGTFGLKASGLLTCVRAASGWQATTNWRARFRRSASALKFWEGDGISHKGMEFVRLSHQTHGELVFINTHLQSQYWNKYVIVRQRQVEQLTSAAASLGVDGVPLLVCGDFNTDPSEQAVYPLFATSPWSDLTTTYRHLCVGCKTLYNRRGDLAAWFDYVIARRDPTLKIAMDLTLENNVRRDDPFSDHQGLSGIVAIESAVAPQPSASVALAPGMCCSQARQ